MADAQVSFVVGILSVVERPFLANGKMAYILRDLTEDPLSTSAPLEGETEQPSIHSPGTMR